MIDLLNLIYLLLLLLLLSSTYLLLQLYYITDLMKNPVLQEKRQEHVTFQKYALELLELVSGKTKNNGAEIEASLVNINRVCFQFKFVK